MDAAEAKLDESNSKQELDNLNNESITDQKDISEEEFKVLGEKKNTKRKKVVRSLPAWISEGVCIESAENIDESASLSNIEFLDKDIKKAMKDLDGFDSLLPAQKHIIPAIINSAEQSLSPPSDICCAAPTGSGKTLAYVLPLIQILRKRILAKTLGAIVIVPTRGLAAQVTSVAAKYGSKLGVKVAEVSANGNSDDDLAILICTPGRLASALPRLNLANLRYLVLDECDRLLADDRHNWLTLLNNAVAQHSKAVGVFRLPLGKLWSLSELTSGPMPLQRLMFSATFSANPTWLAPMCLVKPKLFSVEPPSSSRPHLAAKMGNDDAPTGAPLPQNLTEFAVDCNSSSSKPLVLISLLLSSSLPDDSELSRPALIFTNSSSSATRLSMLLNAIGDSQKIKAACFSGRLSPKRLRQLSQKIVDGKLNIIISTDAAARGFDCRELASVICYDLPQHSRTYIHRAGRTARAGRSGKVFSLVTAQEKKHWRELITGANRQKNIKNLKLGDNDMEPFRETFEKALASTAMNIKTKFRHTKRENGYNPKSKERKQ